MSEPRKIVVEEAGVDASHQTDHCDRCGHEFVANDEVIPTCTHTEHVTLCRSCYRAMGTGVR